MSVSLFRGLPESTGDAADMGDVIKAFIWSSLHLLCIHYVLAYFWRCHPPPLPLQRQLK